jgi:glycosyltransferase involved in cell wall biosynthesis
MPVKNGEKFLNSAFKSILSCVREGDEIIVIDDGSSDSTPSILKNYEGELKNLKVIRSPGTGIVDALNLGIQIAKNDWIARFDVDDEYDKLRLIEQEKRISPGVVAIFADYIFRDTNGKDYGFVASAIYPEATSVSLINSFRTAHSSALINKTAFFAAGGYQKSDFPAEDLGLWLRLSKIGQLVTIPKPLLFYTINQGSVSTEYKVQMQAKKRELLQKYGIPSEDLENLRVNWVSILHSYNNSDSAAQRRILLSRDFIAAAWATRKNRLIFIAFLRLIQLLLYKENRIELLQLVNEKKRRNKIKSSFKF